MKKILLTKVSLIIASLLALMSFSIPSYAALNAGVSAGFTGLQTDALALVDLAWPVVIAVTVAFIIIGLFKKVANKAV